MRIGLVEDHFLFMKGLVFLLDRRDIAITLQASNGLEMCEALLKLKEDEYPEIIIINLNMPEMNGFEAIAWLKINFPYIKIIVLTSQSSRSVIVQTLKLGVNSYLTKNISPSVLIEAIESVKIHGEYYTREISKTLIEILQSGGEVLDIELKIEQLTQREKEIIRLIGEEYTSSEIAKRLDIGPRTIEGHISNIIVKLGVKSRVGIALFASKHGLLN